MNYPCRNRWGSSSRRIPAIRRQVLCGRRRESTPPDCGHSVSGTHYCDVFPPRGYADVNQLSDIAVRFAFHQEAHDLFLAQAKQVVAVLDATAADFGDIFLDEQFSDGGTEVGVAGRLRRALRRARPLRERLSISSLSLLPLAPALAHTGLIRVHADNDNAGSGQLPGDMLGSVGSGEAGHAQIEQNNVRLIGSGQLDCFIAVRCFPRRPEIHRPVRAKNADRCE